jgi:lipoate-protein ligase A
MELLSLTLPSLAENLALDEALLLEAEAGGPEVLRVWEWPSHAVVLGAGGCLTADVAESACIDDGVPILRRASGGGTVLLGRGCLLYSLILRYERALELTEIPSSYDYILGAICLALHPLLELAGTSDLALGGKKVSGNAQQRKRRHLLHHGTLLYQFDLACVPRYLKRPERQPEYRSGRDHTEFMTNLPLAKEELERRLRQVWEADASQDAWPEDQVRRLVQEKYSRAEWTRRR